MKNIVKQYAMGDEISTVLKGINLNVNEGEFLAVLGPSGSGKSTLMNIIGCLDTPTSGDYYLSGRHIFNQDEKTLAQIRSKEIGFIFQSFYLLQRQTALDNVILPLIYAGMGAKEREQRAKSMLERVGLGDKMYHFPNQMSGGQQQRVAIARAISTNPTILLADEPTGAVDTKTSSQIQDLFRQLNRKLGLTIIIVTHDMKLAHKVDRVVMISDGKISTEKILKQHYRDMLDEMENPDMTDETHEEYSVLDKAHRVQLSDDMLAAAGIDTNKVKVRIENGRVVIEAEEKKE